MKWKNISSHTLELNLFSLKTCFWYILELWTTDLSFFDCLCTGPLGYTPSVFQLPTWHRLVIQRTRPLVCRVMCFVFWYYILEVVWLYDIRRSSCVQHVICGLCKKITCSVCHVHTDVLYSPLLLSAAIAHAYCILILYVFATLYLPVNTARVDDVYTISHS